ncbi:MAG: SRPBCC family protein [bacterium]
MSQSILINAPLAKVWDALINPAVIKQYLFGTEAISDWKAGSAIIYKGMWEGKEYADKGQILTLIPEKILATTYWSSFSGLPDAPENYQKVTYEITPENNAIKLTIKQDNILSQEAKAHSEQNWKTVLETIKKILEA